MTRPFWIQPSAWLFARTRLRALDAKQFLQLRRQLKNTDPWSMLRQQTQVSRLLYTLDGWRHPKIWAGTVIELPDECDYLVTEEAVRKLASRRRVALHRIDDHAVRYWTPTEIKTALRDGPIFDQIDLTRRDGTGRRTV